MNNLFTSIILATTICLSTCITNNPNPTTMQKSKCPIKKETTSILYTYAYNSGIGVRKEYSITPDSVVWKYIDIRNGFTLSDKVEYDRKEFDALIDTLSQVAFKVRQVKSTPSSGSGGYAYAFFDDNGKYLGYGVVNNIASGDNQIAEDAIKQFLHDHKTAGEQVAEEAIEKNLLHIDMEEFPESLVPYRVK